MSTYYYLWCDQCKKRSDCFHAQQAWGSWTDEQAHEFLLEHRDHKPYVVDEHSAENEEHFYQTLTPTKTDKTTEV